MASIKFKQTLADWFPKEQGGNAALPVAFVLVAVELQRHWRGSVRWLFLAVVIWVAAIWIGTLAKGAWAMRHANSALDAVVLVLLLGSGYLAFVAGDPDGPDVAATLLFWAPLVCAWWGVAYRDRMVRIAASAFVLYASLFFLGIAGNPPLYDHVILGVLMIILARGAGSRLPSVQDSLSSGNVPDTVLRDTLTGVASPTYFEAELAHTAAVANRYRQSPFSLIVYDIEHYSQHAAEFGKKAVVGLIKGVAWKIADRVRVADTVCRWEDGKIVVLLPNTGIAESRQLASDIGRACRQISLPNGQPLSMRMGVSEHRFGDDPMMTFGIANESLSVIPRGQDAGQG
ncbi:MAG: diguanylate cyclase [Rhodocyclales bacterium]|nr:diguanylate cyclase [Rhodocyclales bacterium]